MGVVGRFAPSPTGRMHAGNIFAALMAWLIARAQDGKIVLRIEDLDTERSKPAYSDAIQRDLEMLGLTWDEGPFFQHDRAEAYQAALDTLQKRGLVYPCFCTRADLHTASAPHQGEKRLYGGTCRGLTEAERQQRSLVRTSALRLCVPDERVVFDDLLQGEYAQNLAHDCGDFLIRRADKTFAYQLAVVVDDAAQGINSTVRGADLLASTPQQIYLQRLLGLPQPTYAHIPLLVNEEGRRLSKRNHDASLEVLLSRFKTPEAIIGYIAHVAGLMPTGAPTTPEELLQQNAFPGLSSRLKKLTRIQWVAAE